MPFNYTSRKSFKRWLFDKIVANMYANRADPQALDRLVIHAMEQRLSEVLRAGERLGIAPEDVLQDLRYRDQFKK
ncbi:hypothetical protein DICVIV_08942 [Dictyocaulus viviparus]|uniref:Uncharacterized protein n=1 Tax=Dictyocaulus viviparus TaxID=29172 RepID=A0A0D8XRI7_DICVI|nr:hypothetical protein DICVIV_08942 [Dictyocaulus viviparus]